VNLLFSSPHCLLDPASGAALSTRDLLELLGSQCGTRNAECGTEMRPWPRFMPNIMSTGLAQLDQFFFHPLDVVALRGRRSSPGS